MAAKAKRGIVSNGAADGKSGPDPRDLKPKEMPCPHCDRLFKQQDRLKQHVAKHHAKEVRSGCRCRCSCRWSGRRWRWWRISLVLRLKQRGAAAAPGASGKGASGAGGDGGAGGGGAPLASSSARAPRNPRRSSRSTYPKRKTSKAEVQRQGGNRLAPGGRKVVLPDKHKPDNDVVIFMNDVVATKDDERGAVAALARGAHTRFSTPPTTCAYTFVALEEKEEKGG